MLSAEIRDAAPNAFMVAGHSKPVLAVAQTEPDPEPRPPLTGGVDWVFESANIYAEVTGQPESVRKWPLLQKWQQVGDPAPPPTVDIVSPVGTAHAYDLAYLLKQAIEKAGSTDRVEVRRSLEQLERHEGLVRVYDPAFSAVDHDALDESDFRLSYFDETGAIVPVTAK